MDLSLFQIIYGFACALPSLQKEKDLNNHNYPSWHSLQADNYMSCLKKSTCIFAHSFLRGLHAKKINFHRRTFNTHIQKLAYFHIRTSYIESMWAPCIFPHHFFSPPPLSLHFVFFSLFSTESFSTPTSPRLLVLSLSLLPISSPSHSPLHLLFSSGWRQGSERLAGGCADPALRSDVGGQWRRNDDDLR